MVLERMHSSKRFVLPTIFEAFFEDNDFQPSGGPLNDYAKEYILKKLYSLSAGYKHYYKYKGARLNSFLRYQKHFQKVTKLVFK